MNDEKAILIVVGYKQPLITLLKEAAMYATNARETIENLGSGFPASPLILRASDVPEIKTPLDLKKSKFNARKGWRDPFGRRNKHGLG
jgi:hypothetical protein